MYICILYTFMYSMNQNQNIQTFSRGIWKSHPESQRYKGGSCHECCECQCVYTGRFCQTARRRRAPKKERERERDRVININFQPGIWYDARPQLFLQARHFACHDGHAHVWSLSTSHQGFTCEDWNCTTSINRLTISLGKPPCNLSRVWSRDAFLVWGSDHAQGMLAPSDNCDFVRTRGQLFVGGQPGLEKAVIIRGFFVVFEDTAVGHVSSCCFVLCCFLVAWGLNVGFFRLVWYMWLSCDSKN